MNKHPIIIGILICLFGASLGFGTSQMTMGNEVRGNSKDIANIRDTINADRTETNRRILAIADLYESLNDLVRASISQTEKLVATIEIQNKMLMEQYKLIETLRAK